MSAIVRLLELLEEKNIRCNGDIILNLHKLINFFIFHRLSYIISIFLNNILYYFYIFYLFLIFY